MNNQRKLTVSLFLLRISVFVVMLMWTIDKFVRPGHAAAVYSSFYHIPGLQALMMYGIGIAELIILVGFVLGIAKRTTYGIVFLIHAVSTFASYPQYLTPFKNVHLLFFAAWPMLAACITLYLNRDADTFMTVNLK